MNINSIDIETHGVNCEPYCVCYIILFKSYSYFGFNCINEAIYSILSKYSEIVLFSHNLTFDGSVIISNVKDEYISSVILNSGNIYKLILSNDKCKIMLKCSTKFLPGSLDSLADKFDLPKN